MHLEKRIHPKIKTGLHPRNKHRERYDFKALTKSCPELAQFVKLNAYSDESIDFSNPEAVRALNKALLKHFYQIDNWGIPPDYLCPPIPGRADYIHHIAELMGSKCGGEIPTGSQFRCLDIGVGSSCVYPIVGNKEYGWSFVGSEIDQVAIESATRIIESNAVLMGKIELRFQPNSKDKFRGIIQDGERFDLTICNPPFHASMAEVRMANLHKVSNLNRRRVTKSVLNFGGQNKELWCEGGEEQFVDDMIHQSKEFASSCFWFSTLISKQTILDDVYETLRKVGAVEVKTLPMGQGSKYSRIVAWTFLTPDEQLKWSGRMN